jgi:hypothetical protein
LLLLSKSLNSDYTDRYRDAEYWEAVLKEKPLKAIKRVLDVLARNEFSKAVRIVAQYEAFQVFPRGLGIDWNNYDVQSGVESLKTIFEKTP